MKINNSEEFELAYRFITETNQNVFLTGKAGTGKTTFLKYLRNNSTKRMVIAAPTGVAAVNARGVTLHSLFQLPPGIILPASHNSNLSKNSFENHPLLSRIHYSKDKIELLSSLELLLIDEVSMLPSYNVDAIDIILRHIKQNPETPFGGVQILFIGDLNQLPPVVKNEDWKILKEYYSSIFFFDSIILRENIPVMIEFKNIYRQRDEKFIEILNEIRDNNITEENFRLLNSRINKDVFSNKDDNYIILTTHNNQADVVNKIKLEELHSTALSFDAEITGNFPEHNLPADKRLLLKPGAQVMFLKNDTEGKQYFNGKIGTVTEIDRNGITVFCNDDQQEIVVKKSEWQNIKYKLDSETREIKEEVLGSFIQYPLKLAWAITIHKSQGLTFDKVIIDASRAFAPGQIYVALSRCTSLDGIILASPIYKNSLVSHNEIGQWLAKYNATNLLVQFNQARQDFILQELLNVFTWGKWYQKLEELRELLQENISVFPEESIVWLNNLMIKQKELYDISEKFKEIIAEMSSGNSDVENSLNLQSRIKSAAKYFFNEIERWMNSLKNHPIRVSTKKPAHKADKLPNEITVILFEILTDMNCCKNGFLLKEYLQNKKSLNSLSFTRNAAQIKSTYERDKTVKYATIKETVRLLQQGKSPEQIAAERNLVIGTIEGHIARAIKRGLIQIKDVMLITEVEKIAEFFPKNLDNIRLSVIKERVPSEITYGKLRIVQAYLERKRG